MQPPSFIITGLTPILIGMTGCPSNIAEAPAPTTTLIEAENYQGVLFNATEAQRQRLDIPITIDTLDFWSPSTADIERLESQILPALLTDERLSDDVGFINPMRPLEEALPDYTRQYFGYLTNDGERIIYASFFCDVPVEELTVGLGVADGGECFFQIHYNIDTDEYFDLQVNGVA